MSSVVTFESYEVENMKTKIIVALLAIILASCAPVVTPAPTKTPSLTFTPAPTATPAPKATSTLVLLTPSPWPTMPFPITPDAGQLARWQEYEKALAEKFISHHIPEDVLCEWVLLGQSEQEVYVWANCQSTFPDADSRYAAMSAPAVIYIGTAGSVQNVRIAFFYPDDVHSLFPPDIQKVILANGSDLRSLKIQMSEHIISRVKNPEPPLIVLIATALP
jgi:hypothetical protein